MLGPRAQRWQGTKVSRSRAGAIVVAAGALLRCSRRREWQTLGETGADLRGKVLHETEKLRDGAKESARKIVAAAADQAMIETGRAVRALEEAVDAGEPPPAAPHPADDQ